MDLSMYSGSSLSFRCYDLLEYLNFCALILKPLALVQTGNQSLPSVKVSAAQKVTCLQREKRYYSAKTAKLYSTRDDKQ